MLESLRNQKKDQILFHKNPLWRFFVAAKNPLEASSIAREETCPLCLSWLSQGDDRKYYPLLSLTGCVQSRQKPKPSPSSLNKHLGFNKYTLELLKRPPRSLPSPSYLNSNKTNKMQN